MICRHKLNHFTVANTRFTAPLTRRGKTKFATIKMIQFMPANHSITNVLSPNRQLFLFPDAINILAALAKTEKFLIVPGKTLRLEI